MAVVASQLIDEATAHAQSDRLEDAREICADSTYFQNNLRKIFSNLYVYHLTCSECAKRNVQHPVGSFRTRINESVKHFSSNVITQNSLNTCLKTNMP